MINHALHGQFAGALFLLLGAAMANAEDYRFSIEPEFPPEQAEEIYAPLMAYLSRETGHTFILEVPRNYHLLWRDMRKGAEIDFTFEDAPFVDFRVQRQGFESLVRIATASVFSLIALPETAERGLDGLVGYRIVSMPAPSLGYAVLSRFYRNPISQPEVLSVAATWRDGVEMVFAGEAEAAMVPNYIAELYPNLALIQESSSYPARAVSAARGVPEDVREAVRAALLRMHEDESLYSVLNEIGVARFEPTTAEDYVGQQAMLRGFFGYTE